MPYIRYNHWLPRLLRVQGITLVPFILFAVPKDQVTDEMHKHELIHVQQVGEVGWSRFYVAYLLQYISNRRSGLDPDAAYRAISFEVSAYSNQDSPLTEDEKKFIA